MSSTRKSSGSLSPLTFKITPGMLKEIEALIKEGTYTSKAELIREAIQELIDWELNLESLIDRNLGS